MAYPETLAQARLLLSDLKTTFQDSFVSDGVQQRYKLSKENFDPTTFVAAALTVPQTPLAVDVDYTLDAVGGFVTLLNPAQWNGTTVVFQGEAGVYFTDAEWKTYLDLALAMHNHGRSPTIAYDTVELVEGYLIAMRAVIEALWTIANDLATQIDIHAPEGVTIPRSERYAQVRQQVQGLEAHYREMAQQLNVGLERIEMLTLRRVSRTTGRLVPIYVPQEYDDISYPPVRVLPPIDSGLT